MNIIQNSTIRNSMRVALWEVRKLVCNKAFIISLLLTPVLLGLFMGLPILLERIEEPDAPGAAYMHTYIYIIDEIGIYGELSQKLADTNNLVLKKYTGHKDGLSVRIKDNPHAGYVHITEEIFETRSINIITSDYDTRIPWVFEEKLTQVLMRYEFAMHNIEPEDAERIIAGYEIIIGPLAEEAGEIGVYQQALPPPPSDPMVGEVTRIDFTDGLREWIPAIFAMIIFCLVFISGMTTMQSAISDKRDKMVEILLSSVSANSLMYGKIIGNFFAGLIQLTVYFIYALMFIHFVGIPGLGDITLTQLLSYILSPELPLLLLFALVGYLLFSSLYAGMGATMEDMQNAGHFQGIVMFLPWLPILFIFDIIANPEGLIAQIGSYIPFTSSVVMIVRMTLIDLSLIEIIIPLVILLASTMLMARLAGKIFRTGMLMYGKDAGPREMWKWLRQ